MTNRQAAIIRIATCLKNRGITIANERNITEVLCQDKTARNLWQKRYSVTSPTGMSGQKIKRIIKDVQSSMEGEFHKQDGEEIGVKVY